MQKNKWYPWQNQNIINGTVEFLFISKNNEICTLVVEDYKNEKVSELGTILAVRIVEIKKIQKKQAVKQSKKYVFYWNWKTRKVWPMHLTNPPSAKLPYLKVELYDEDPPRTVYSLITGEH